VASGWSTAGHPPARCRLRLAGFMLQASNGTGDAPPADLRDVRLADRGPPDDPE
jgi:hypothetical protein